MLLFVSELDGEYLDLAVMLALPNWSWLDDAPQPSLSYTDGGPLLEYYKLELRPVYVDNTGFFSHWEASVGLSRESWASRAVYCKGPTILIAAARCLVANMLGEQVDL